MRPSSLAGKRCSAMTTPTARDRPSAGLLMHLRPAEGRSRAVGVVIAEHLFPANEDGRIPVVGVTGSTGKTTVAQLIAQLLQLSGKYVGLACGAGLYLAQRQIETKNCAN